MWLLKGDFSHPTTSDLVDITGGLTIQPGAALSVLPDFGNYPDFSSYTIVQTTGSIRALSLL